MRLRPAILFVVLALAVATAASVSWFAARDPASTLPWQHAQAPTTLVLSGNVEAHESALSFQGVQSTVVDLPFDEGHSVHRGDTVALVDASDLQQQVVVSDAAVVVQERQLDSARQNVEAARQAVEVDRAGLAQRELDAARMRSLREQGFESQAALDTADTALVQARAALGRDQALEAVARTAIDVAQAGTRSAQEVERLARIQQGFTTLRAPFDGVILSRQAELGEVVAPGTPIVTLADLDHVWVRAYVNETDLGRIRIGQPAVVATDSASDRPRTGRLSFIASQAEFTPKSVDTHAERVTLVYRVKIDLDNPDHALVPGMPVDVRLDLARP